MQGSVALVTGSTRGIGRAIAERFAAEGATVVVSGRAVDDGEAVAKAIRADGGTARFCAADVTVDAAVEGLVAFTLEHYGRIDVLVNNAAPMEQMATGLDGVAGELDMDRWRTVLDGTLDSAFRCIRAVLAPMMSQRDGVIVNISSLASLRGVAGVSAYAAAKAGLNGLTRSVAVEYAPFGIRCNTVVAGSIDTYGAAPPPRADGSPDLGARIPMGEPVDVANAVLFLVSSEARFITGVLLPVDGGISARAAVPPVARPQSDS